MIKYLLLLLCVNTGCGNYYEYRTEHGIKVHTEMFNSPEKDEVEEWTQYTINFWEKYDNEWSKCMFKHNRIVSAYFLSEDHVLSGGKKYAGLAFLDVNYIFISNGADPKVHNVFVHELSHIYVAHCGGYTGNDDAHELFKEEGLEK